MKESNLHQVSALMLTFCLTTIGGCSGRPDRSSPELCVKVRGSSSMLLLGCLGDLLRFEKREIQVATFAPDRSSP